MSETVHTRSLRLPPIDQGEVLRYMGAKGAGDDATAFLLSDCIQEAGLCFCGRICWRETTVERWGDWIGLSTITTESRALAKALKGCESAVLFAATVGVEIDRLMMRYSRLSPARAVCMQALGAERIEALCDAFEDELRTVYADKRLRPRFSPGYGDLPLSIQKELFDLLDCPRRIGLTLNDSLLMSPTKSVTAVIGLSNEP